MQDNVGFEMGLGVCQEGWDKMELDAQDVTSDENVIKPKWNINKYSKGTLY